MLDFIENTLSADPKRSITSIALEIGFPRQTISDWWGAKDKLRTLADEATEHDLLCCKKGKLFYPELENIMLYYLRLIIEFWRVTKAGITAPLLTAYAQRVAAQIAVHHEDETLRAKYETFSGRKWTNNFLER